MMVSSVILISCSFGHRDVDEGKSVAQAVMRGFANNNASLFKSGLVELSSVSRESVEAVPLSVAPEVQSAFGRVATLRFKLGDEYISFDGTDMRLMDGVLAEWIVETSPITVGSSLDRFDTLLGRLFDAARQDGAIGLMGSAASFRLAVITRLKAVHAKTVPLDLDQREAELREAMTRRTTR